MTSPTVGIIDAVDKVITKAREVHSDIPEKIVVVLESGKRKSSMVHGHFAKLSWIGMEAVDRPEYHEIKLGTESLARGPIPTLGTILHELSHAIAFERGVKDTSNKGRYHNGKFREIGLDLGIHLEKVGTIGWSQTIVPDGTVETYREQVDLLESSITTYRKGFAQAVDPKGTSVVKSRPKMVCGCNEPLAVTTKWFNDIGQYALCQNCSENFRLEEKS